MGKTDRGERENVPRGVQTERCARRLGYPTIAGKVRIPEAQPAVKRAQLSSISKEPLNPLRNTPAAPSAAAVYQPRRSCDRPHTISPATTTTTSTRASPSVSRCINWNTTR